MKIGDEVYAVVNERDEVCRDAPQGGKPLINSVREMLWNENKPRGEREWLCYVNQCTTLRVAKVRLQVVEDGK